MPSFEDAINSAPVQIPKLEVWLWDDADEGQWGEAYVDVDPNDNVGVHKATAEFIDLDLELGEDRLLYRVNLEGLGINIGYYSRNFLYIELWGPRALAMVSCIKAQLDWYPKSPSQALTMLNDMHDVVKRAQGD
jgi:hypothetical protein